MTKLTSFGVFVELESDLEGLLHISELSEKKINSPDEVVSPGEEIDVRIIRVEPQSRKIGLSLRKVKGLPSESAQPGVRRDEGRARAEAAPEQVAEAAHRPRLRRLPQRLKRRKKRRLQRLQSRRRTRPNRVKTTRRSRPSSLWAVEKPFWASDGRNAEAFLYGRVERLNVGKPFWASNGGSRDS